MNTRRKFLAGAFTSALAATFAACSADVPSTPQSTGKSVAHPVLSADRLNTVLTRIQSGLATADAQHDADLLAGYLSGPAARIRAQEYVVATTSGDESLIHTFSTTSQAGAVGLTMDFPRTSLTITEPTSADDPPYLLILDQATARESVKLWGWVSAFAGVEVPATATASVGSEQVDAQATDLVATPSAVLDSYIAALNDPAASTNFADDSLQQRIASERGVDLSGMGTVTVTASAGSDGFRGLRTSDGGAIVMTTLNFVTVYTKTVAGATLNVGGQVGALLGDTQVVGSVSATYDVMIAFSIPSAQAGGNAVALGADLVLAGVARDDSAAPAA